MRVTKAALRRRADVEAHLGCRHAGSRYNALRCAGLGPRRHDDIGRQLEIAFAGGRLFGDLSRYGNAVGLQLRGADLQAGGGERT